MMELLCELINATLCGRTLELKDIADEEWEQCFDLALQQQVLAMTFPTVSALPKEKRPSFLLWSKWMAYAQNISEQARHKQESVRKMGSWLAEEGLTTLIVKGFSVAMLYPNPNLREFCDIDIYSGRDFDAVNACLAKHGLSISEADGHHVHIMIDGVKVEHHFSFDNSRVKGGKDGMENVLRQHAKKDRHTTEIPGICIPNPVFTALFVGWHAYKHFLHEKIELRHVIDWAMALKQLSQEDGEILHEVKGGALWGHFVDVMTAIALHRLHLPKDWFPKWEVERAEAVDWAEEQRVWNDIIDGRHNVHSKNLYLCRLIIARRLLQNRWKFKAYSDESAGRFLWQEFVGFITRKSQ